MTDEERKKKNADREARKREAGLTEDEKKKREERRAAQAAARRPKSASEAEKVMSRPTLSTEQIAEAQISISPEQELEAYQNTQKRKLDLYTEFVDQHYPTRTGEMKRYLSRSLLNPAARWAYIQSEYLNDEELDKYFVKEDVLMQEALQITTPEEEERFNARLNREFGEENAKTEEFERKLKQQYMKTNRPKEQQDAAERKQVREGLRRIREENERKAKADAEQKTKADVKQNEARDVLTERDQALLDSIVLNPSDLEDEDEEGEGKKRRITEEPTEKKQKKRRITEEQIEKERKKKKKKKSNDVLDIMLEKAGFS